MSAAVALQFFEEGSIEGAGVAQRDILPYVVGFAHADDSGVTQDLSRMNRKAMSGMVIPAGK